MSLENSPNFVLNLSECDVKGEDKHFYKFKSFRLDVEERQLLHHSSPVPLTPKAFDVLTLLVVRSGHLVDKDELLESVWADSFVEEQNITRIVHTLRKVLGEDENGNKFIETVAKKGYRFVAKVNEVFEPVEQKSTNDRQQMSVPSAVAGDLTERFESSALVSKDKLQPPAAVGGSDLLQKPKARIILFSVGFLCAIFLIFLLSFNFRSGSSVDPNKVTSIAVMPVKPISAGVRDEVYEIGIADSLIIKLGSMKGFIVRPLSATRQYAGIEQDAIAAGNEQKVDYVLASNYQIADGKIRITAQLFNVASGQIEETYKGEKDAANLFAMQDAIAGEIGNLLRTRFVATSRSPMARRGTDNEEAYRLYLQGTALADKRTQKDVRKAAEYFEQAVGLDPNYALAYARLANAQTALNFSSDTYPKAKAAIEKALVIDDTLAEAHSYLGEIKADFEWDFAGAEREHRKAIELNPNSSVAHRMYALLLGYLGRHDESIAESKIAIDLEPASVMNHLVFGRSLLFARRYDEAITELERTAEMDPEFFFAHLSLSVAYRFKGDDDRAFESFVETEILAGEGPGEINLWKTIYAKSGWRGVFARQFEAAKEEEKNGKPNHNQLANFSIELGQHEQAFAYLEKTFVQRRWAMVMLNIHPRYDPLRSDPRFDDLVRRVGLK